MEKSSPASRIQANLTELFKDNLDLGNTYIRFQLTSDMTALLSMKQAQESLIVEAEKITPLPNMSESVIGIMTSRNQVFCVFDLAQLLRLSSQLISPREYQIIVLQTTSEKPIYIGLAVTRFQGIVRLATEQIKWSLDAFPSNIAPYLCGAVQEEETMIPILDFNPISEALTTVRNN